MSNIPTPGSGKPMLKRSTTVTSKLPTGTRTVTNTNITELRGCTSKGTQLPGEKQDCATCPSRTSGLPQARPASRLQAPASYRATGTQQAPPQQAAVQRAPQQAPQRVAAADTQSNIPACCKKKGGAAAGAGAPSGLRAPSTRTPVPAPAPVPAADSQSNLPACCRKKGAAPSGLRPPTAISKMPSPELPPPPPPRGPLKPLAGTSRQHVDITGQYYLPAEFGPKTLKGKGTSFSSPPQLRGQIEDKMPQELRYYSNKQPLGGRERAALQQAQGRQTMQDIMAGSFNIPERRPRVEESIINAGDISLLEKTANIRNNTPIMEKPKQLHHLRRLSRSARRYSDPPVPMDLSKEITKMLNVDARRKERISEYMCKSIRQTRLKVFSKAPGHSLKALGRPTTSKEMRTYCKQAPPIQMTRFQEKRIRDMIKARGLEKVYPQLVADIMKETKAEYVTITHYAAVNLKVKDVDPGTVFRIDEYKHVGRTENYQRFIYTKNKLRRIWILHNSLIRKLLEELIRGLPYALFELNFHRVVDLSQFQFILKDKVQIAEEFLYDFFSTISKLVDQETVNLENNSVKYLGACTGLLSLHVSRSIAHTMLHVVNGTELMNVSPYLKLFVDFEDGLVLHPTAEEIINVYKDFLGNLMNAGSQLHVLESSRIKGYRNKRLYMCLTQEFISNCNTRINININKLYEPIFAYLEKLSKDFQEIYIDIINTERFFESISDILFDNGIEKIHFYKNYINKVAYIPDNEYFKIGELVLTNYRKKLHIGLKFIIDSIFEKLRSQHLWEVNDICDGFRLIHMRATRKPLTTEELIEIGRFMTWIRNEQLGELNQRVTMSLDSLCRIIQLGFLTEDHMEANAAAIKWLNDIQPIVDQHAINFDQLKFEAEEKLQKVIEDINILIKNVYPLLVILDEMDNIKLTRKYLHTITLHMAKIKEIAVQIDWINKEEVCLSFPKSSYAEFEDLKNYVYPFYHLLKLCLDVERNVSVWYDGQFELLDYEKTNVAVERFCKELTGIQKEYKKKLRQAQDENLPIRFRGTVDDPDLLNWPAPLKLCATSIKLLEEFKQSLKVMEIMCNGALRPRHWTAMSEIAGFNITPHAGTTLRKLIKIDLKSNIHEYEIISIGATKEKELLDNLNVLKGQWNDIMFRIDTYGLQMSLLTHLEDIEAVVDDHTIKVLNMRGSVFVQPYEKDVLEFYDKILKIAKLLEDWAELQKQWVKLSPIFLSENVREILPKESQHFAIVDDTFTTYIKKITENPVVIEIITTTDIVNDTSSCVAKFEEIKKGVKSYLEQVRQNCPRLYFVADQEMLELIAKRENIFDSKHYLVKLFPGIHELRYKNDTEIIGMVSKNTEFVAFNNNIEVSSLRNFETFVNEIEIEMIVATKHLTSDCYKIFKRTELLDLIHKYPQQSIQLMTKVFWTEYVEDAIKLTRNIKLRIYSNRLDKIIGDKLKILKTNKITNFDRTVIKNVLVTDLNNKYILNNLLQYTFINEDTFEWRVQIKYYFIKTLCTTQCMQHEIKYSYEYLGNAEPIVLTPLTERCYVTLLNAYFYNFNGLVRGCSGTGKTETIRSLAQAFAMLFVMFNCTTKLRCRKIQRLLKGTAMCGSWLCFENFNLLSSDVLSIISQDFMAILSVAKEKLSEVYIDQALVSFKPTCCIFTVLNNESRVQLPENLKPLFRTYTLSQPDMTVIAETLLYAAGYESAKQTSKKIITVFNLLENVLSTESHCYFGMRSLLQIIYKYNQLKMSYNLDEQTVVVYSIMGVFKSAISDTDTVVLDQVLKAVFPTYDSSAVSEGVYSSLLENICEDLNLHLDENFLRKTFEAYELLRGQRSVVLVGGACTGKSTIIKICAKMFEISDNIKVLVHTVNTKCLPYSDLFGKIDQVTGEWFDGIIVKNLRKISGYKTDDRKWLIFDGSIDRNWTDNLNSMLESDSKVFLESGEVLLIQSLASIIFEVKDLNEATPSTISRCKVIYLSSQVLGWLPVLKSWLSSYDSEWFIEHKTQTSDLLLWFFPPCLEMIENFKQTYKLEHSSMVSSTLKLFQMIMDDVISKTNKKEEDPKNISTWIHASLLQAGIWGLGSILDFTDRQKFDEFYKNLWRGQNKYFPYPKSTEKLDVGIPQESTLYDYHYIYKQRGTWKLWIDLLKNEKISDSPYMTEFLVPTVDTMRYNYLLDLHIKYNEYFLLIGPSGTGKSLLVRDCMINRLDEVEFEKAVITFNIHLTSRPLQNLILSKLNKRKSGYYSPPINKRFICFIEDLNLHSKDQNQNSALELLRQYFDYKTWYDLKSLDAIYFDKSNFLASITASGKPGKQLCSRFLRHFNIYSINEFSSDVVNKLFSQVLMYSWKKAGLSSDVVGIVTQIVSATTNTYQFLKNRCKPTLSKCYYIFNLRNFSAVIKNCGILKKETYDLNKKIYLKLWVHEMLRVFGDRLSSVDNKWLSQQLKTTIEDHFNEPFLEIFTNFDEERPFSNLFFGTLNHRDFCGSICAYDELTNLENLVEIARTSLSQYNEMTNFKLNLLFIEYALEKLIKICRILAIYAGNALFLGDTGCGRQSLIKLACFMYKYELHQPAIKHNYDVIHWNADVKMVLKKCGGLDQRCVFLLTEEQLISEQFFENIDHLLRNGEITDFYDREEKQELLELARLSAQGGNRNLDISSAAVFLYFNKRCKENLSLILCFNIGEKLRQRLLNYSSLADCYVSLWEDWPDKTLDNVAKIWIKDVNLLDNVKESAIYTAIHFHRTSQSYLKDYAYITPKSYVHLFNLFSEIMIQKQKDLLFKKKTYLQGLARLSYASEQILDMQKALAEYQPQLEEMTQNASEMTKQIALETIEVEKASALVRKDEKVAGEQAAVAQVLKSECESELAQAIPILEDAISALNTLKPSDITLVKSMKNPPDAIKLVMASVCVIKDVRPDKIPDPSTGRKTFDYWGPSKRILGDMNFLQTLKDFDKDHIKSEIILKIRKEFLPHKDFKPHIVAKASSAAEGLCKWIIAMDMYDKVAKEVAPKKEKLNKAEKEYAETMRILNEKKEEVARIEEKLAGLNVLLNEAVKKQSVLQIEVDICNKKLKSAQKLIGGLSGEKLRWTEAADNLQKHYEVLTGDILLSSAVIAYLAPLKSSVRSKTVALWHEFMKQNKLPCSEVFDITQVLSSDVEVEVWRQNGLPLDNFFVENAIMLRYSKQFCILTDPQYQASNWIQKTEDGNDLIVTKFTHEDCLQKIKDCIKFGNPLLIKDSKEFIPPYLNNVVFKQTCFVNDDKWVALDGEKLLINKHFRIYLICNKSGLQFSSGIASRTTIINFSMTQTTLQEEMLRIVTEIERPDIKKLTKEYKRSNAENKSKLKKLESKILTTLCESKTDILEDEASILILDESKELARILRESQEESKKIEDIILQFREGYTNVAKYIGNLYFCVTQLDKINGMYQFSYDWYKDIYFSSILNAAKSKVLEIRCEQLISTFTYDLSKSVLKGLFEKDKLLFKFCLATRILIFQGDITKSELLFFLGSNSITAFSEFEEPKPNWLSVNAWEGIRKAESLPAFKGLIKSITTNETLWKDCIHKSENFNGVFPNLNALNHLSLTKILTPEKLYRQIEVFLTSVLGEKNMISQPFNMQETYNETYSLSPVLFILTPGLNPLKTLHEFASIKKVLHKFKYISMDGCGSNKNLDKLIKVGQQEGYWILLQNCHLATGWVETLERNLETFNCDNTHENFRLFLTTESSNSLPVELIQRSIKVVDETPNNVKHNLIKIYSKHPFTNEEFFYGCPGRHEMFTKLLYRMCLSHCILQTRKLFPNWNVPHQFVESDLLLSLKQLQLFINENKGIFDDIYYVVGECNYSGYLENMCSKRFVNAVLSDCLNNSTIGKNNLSSAGGAYKLPTKYDQMDYLRHISNMPDEDYSRMLYLTDFELERIKTANSQLFLDKGLNLLENIDTQHIVKFEFKILNTIDEIKKQLPAYMDSNYCDSVVGQEIQHYNNLLQIIGQSLFELREALAGKLPLTSELEEIGLDIAKLVVPKLWKKFSYPTLFSLARYIQDLKKRVVFLTNFSQKKDVSLLLGAFYFPNAVIFSKILKTIKKQSNMSIEDAVLDFEILDTESGTVPPDELLVEELFILGAKWDKERKVLTELLPKTYYDKLPMVLIKIVNSLNLSVEDRLECPLYKVEPTNGAEIFLRGCSNFVLLILLNHNKDGSRWIKRGISTVCEVIS